MRRLGRRRFFSDRQRCRSLSLVNPISSVGCAAIARRPHGQHRASPGPHPPSAPSPGGRRKSRARMRLIARFGPSPIGRWKSVSRVRMVAAFNPSPIGRLQLLTLLPLGEGGAKRRMRVCCGVNIALRPDPHPPSAPELAPSMALALRAAFAAQNGSPAVWSPGGRRKSVLRVRWVPVRRWFTFPVLAVQRCTANRGRNAANRPEPASLQLIDSKRFASRFLRTWAGFQMRPFMAM